MLLRACKLKNFGDTLNTELVRLISGASPTIVNNKFENPNNETIYMCIGSVLGWADSSTIIWGTGKMSTSDNTMFKSVPKKICAVRGPLTREQIINRGFECPEIYGDPALLMPTFYQPTVKKEYKLGIICHHIDKICQPWLKDSFPDAFFIDIQDGIYKVIDDVNRCEKIVSSALHGIIIADAYNVPAIWMKISDKVLGHGFKFRDYFLSVNRYDQVPLIYTDNITLKDILNKFNVWNSPSINLDPLWEACPFKKDKL